MPAAGLSLRVMKNIIAATVASVLLAAPAAAAQGPTSLEPDMRVRVWTSAPDPIVGKVIKTEGSSLFIKAKDGRDVRFERESVVGLEIGRPKSRAHNFFVGVALGAVAGFALGVSASDGICVDILCFSPMAAGAGLAILGAPIGGVMGALVNPGINWETTAIGPVRTSIPRPSLKYSFRF